MNVAAATALLASLVILAIGASVLLRDRTRRTHTSFAAFTFTVAAWHLCNFIATATDSPLVKWLALWPAATIPPTAVAFFREFLAQPSIGGRRRPPRVTLAWTIAAYIALIYSAIFVPIHEDLVFQLPFGAYVFGGLYRCVYDLFVQYRATTKRAERTRIRYLMLGGFVATTLALTDVLPRFGVAWPALGNVLTVLYLYFLSQTLFRYRLLDLNELVGKMAVLGTLVVLLWAVYGLLLAWVGGGQEGLFLLNALVASFVILILFEPVRTRLESGINRWLVRQRDALRGRLEKLRRELAHVVDASELASLIIQALEEARRVTHASVYLLDPDGAGFDRARYYGEAPIERIDVATDHVLIDRLREGHLEIDDLRHDLDVTKAQADKAAAAPLELLLRQLQSLEAELVFPLLSSAEAEAGPWLLGFIAIRDERSENAFDSDDIELFRQLAAQAARAIESSQVYERVKERDRLAAIGEMAAGLAHEIRNPLGAIKGAAQLLLGPDGKPIAPTSESGEFLEIIIEEVDRLNNVVSQFLDFARLERSETSNKNVLDVNEVVRKTVQLVGKREDAQKIEFKVRLDELLPPVAGDAESLLQVFLNLAINAVQAMPDGGTLDITTTRRRRSRLGYGSFAEVRISDTGEGIPRETIKNLFIPFFTTKSRGTGLGLAISARIVNQHAGTIEVRSTPGKGSVFSVFLPAAAEKAAAKDGDRSTPPTAAATAASSAQIGGTANVAGGQSNAPAAVSASPKGGPPS